MDRINSPLSLRGSKIPRRKFTSLSPKYNAISSVVNSASCSNNFTTSTTNLLSTNIPTTANNISYAQISEGSLALTQTLISNPIYTFSSSSPTPHSSSSNTGIETWAQNLTTPNLHPSPQTINFSAPPIINQSLPINLKLPSFWENDIELWLAAVEHQFNLYLHRATTLFRNVGRARLTRHTQSTTYYSEPREPALSSHKTSVNQIVENQR